MNEEEIISLFHRDIPLSYKLEEIRNEPEDKRYIIYAEFPHGKFVIKIACNSFTSHDRIKCWVDLISEYKKMGYYSPEILKSLNNNYSENIDFKGHKCVVWEEEFSKYETAENTDIFSEENKNFCKEVLEFIARTGQKHFEDFNGNSAWSRFEPMSPEEITDEITECVLEFASSVRKNAPQFIPRLKKVLRLFGENRRELANIYFKLPKSVFQADFGKSNLLIENGHFMGVLDYNIAGKETVLNMFMSELYWVFCCHAYFKSDGNPLGGLNPQRRDFELSLMYDALKYMGKFYDFSELEIQAAPLLYKYIFTIGYTEIELLEKYKNVDEKLDLLFDFIEHELERNDLDFESAMNIRQN